MVAKTAIAILAIGAGALSQPHLEDMTWVEVRDAVRAGKTTVIVPTGGTEQNGPHMVLGKHNYRIRHNAGLIAARLGNALVAPVMAYVPEGGIDPPEGHMRFAGTITLPDEHFRKVLEWTARSLKVHGFRDIVFIGDSGPNQPGMKAVTEALNAEWKSTQVRCHFIPEYYRGNGFEEYLLAQGISKADVGTHAGVHDTSLLMAVDGRLIRRNKIANNGGFEGSGVTGNPAKATAALGRKGIEMIVARTAELIRKSIAAR